MEEKKNKFLIKSYKQMFLVIGIFTLVLLVGGTTYAFFNYTRTGSANTLRTGRIYFSTEQTNQNTITLNNIFPMTKEQALADTSSNGTLVVTFNGDTTYTDGMEYLLSIDSVTGTTNVPISLIMNVNITENNVAVAENTNYYTAREAKTASMYKAEGVDTTINSTTHKVITDIETGKHLLAGYIKSGTDVVNGTVTIKAFIDADNILITDTPNDQSKAPTGYTDGTVTTGKTVISTTDWNALSSSGISFKVKGEARPGIWVEEPEIIPTISSCPDCKFIYSTQEMYTTWNTDSQTPTQITSGLYDNYEELIESTGKNYFLGVKLNSNNEVTNAYACGVKDDVPFCIEESSGEGKYTYNQTFLQSEELYNNSCDVEMVITTCGTRDNFIVELNMSDFSTVGTNTSPSGFYCAVGTRGSFGCQ